VLLAAEDTVSADEVRVILPGMDDRMVAAASHSAANGAAGGTGTLAERAEAFEREVLIGEIRRHNFHMTNVSRALGLERSHLYKKCQQLGIDLQLLRKPD